MPVVRITVIIPTLNEERWLGETIESVFAGTSRDVVDIVVADGGSRDRTLEIAKSLGVRAIRTEQGRGAQMDRAAELCGRADVFLFLHADTLLPEGWYDAVKDALKDGSVVAGGFRLSINSRSPWARIIEKGVALRAALLGLIYGDQAIFVRADIFRRAGGFRRLPLLEDVDLIRRVRRFGRVVVLEKRVLTSPRRWQKRGYVFTTLRNWLYLLLYYAGVSPQRLYKGYYKT